MANENDNKLVTLADLKEAFDNAGQVKSVAGKTGAVTLAKGDVGLGNVDNKSSETIRGEITSSNVTTALGYTPINASLKGAASGIAELDTSGKVPSSQLPSYVDDVLEYSKLSSFPATGETGKIYIAQDTNKTYRWSGTAYVEISASLALGTTSSTAYRGDYGNTAYSHASAKGSAFSSGLYKITTNSEGHVTAATAVAKSDITGLGIPGSDTTYAFDGTYNASTNKAATVSTVTNAISTISENGDINIESATAGASLYGVNFYIRYNKVVYIHFGFKLESATVGKAYTIAVNIPASCQPPFSSTISLVASNGDPTGSTNVVYNAPSGFTAYAGKSGTTYAIGSMTYLIM